MKFDNQNLPPTNPNLRMQETHLTQTNAVNENAHTHTNDLSMATEFLDNSATKEEKRKARAEKVEQLIKLTIDDGGMFSSDEEKKALFKELTRDSNSINVNMRKIDFHALKDEAEKSKLSQDLDKELINKIKDGSIHEPNNDVERAVSEYVNLKPDSEIFLGVIDLIDKVDLNYLEPYQDVTEILSQMFAKFTELSSVMSKMISNGQVNTETNNITVNLTEFKTSLDSLLEMFYSPTSPMVIKLKSFQFLPKDLDKATDLALGSGLIVVGGPPNSTHYWLEVDPATRTNLNIAWTGIAGNSPGNYTVEITTYGLQAFQTSFNSTGDSISSQMQGAAEKFRRALATVDSMTKMFSAFFAACIDANKGFTSF